MQIQQLSELEPAMPYEVAAAKGTASYLSPQLLAKDVDCTMLGLLGPSTFPVKSMHG